MGLDMHAYTTSADIPAVDFEEPDDCAELFYWRKHPNLHGWMEAIYREKGGRATSFNLETVRLDRADIDALEKAVNEDSLPETTGFFFGQSKPEEKQRDLEFIRGARLAMENGKKVFCTSWW